MTDRGEPTPSHEYFLDLARALPKIPVDDPRVQEIIAETDKSRNVALRAKYFGHFGNNYFMLFDALRLQRNGRKFESASHFGSQILRVEHLGKPFKQFLANNAELLGDIDTSLEEYEKGFGQIFHYVLELLDAGRSDDLSELNAATGHPLGLSAIEYSHWDRMNPLLVKAAQQMEAVGIDPTEFYG